MSGFLRRHWFLVSLVVLIPAGVALGKSNPPQALIDGITQLPTSLCTAGILFLMSVTLDSRRLVKAIRRPAPVIVACGINQGLIPLLALPLLGLQQSADMKVGLLIAASVPCTMAAASVWTRRAGGNDAVSLLVTLLTNGLCFVVTPLWLAAGTAWFGTVDASAALGFTDMMLRLIKAALVPALAGQLLRISPAISTRIDRNKKKLSVVAQSIILLLVFVSCFKGGLKFDSGQMGENLRHAEFAVVWLSCVGLHVFAMAAIWPITGLLRLAEPDRRACVMAGSQKTLPVGILVSQATGLPFSLLPMLMYHASQLFIDTWVADHLKRRDTTDIDPSAEPDVEDDCGDAG